MTEEPEESEQVGFCAVIVNVEKETVCGAKAESEVLVRNPFGLFACPICPTHSDQHRAFYQERRRRHGKFSRRKQTNSR